MSDFKEYLPIINVFGFIALGVAVWYTQFKTGSNQISGEVITNYKALDEQKNNQLSSLQKDIEEIKATMRAMEKGFIERIAKLEGQLKEKDRQIKDLNEILANRNPKLEQILEEIHGFMKELRDTNVHQTNILERGQTRDVKIDKATNKEEGKVLRNT